MLVLALHVQWLDMDAHTSATHAHATDATCVLVLAFHMQWLDMDALGSAEAAADAILTSIEQETHTGESGGQPISACIMYLTLAPHLAAMPIVRRL
jgi:hypothetical protein